MAGRRATFSAAGGALSLALAIVGTGGSAASREPGADDSLRLGVPGAASSGVSLAAAGTEVAVTWAATSDGATDIYAAWSGDGGASFKPAIRVNDIAGDARVTGEQAPRVALGRGGVDVVWISKRGGVSFVLAATMLGGKQSFGPARTVHAENLSGARGWHSLAVDRAGALHVAWLDGRNAHLGGKSMRQDLFQAVWRREGARDETMVASDVCFCCKTALASAGNGTTYVAWRHIYPTNLRDIAVARSADGGKTFGAPVRVSEDGWQIAGCPDDGPSIGVDASGTVHVVWPTMVAGGTPGKGVFYSYSSDGGRTFASRMRVDDGDGVASHAQLAVGGNRVAVVWDKGGAQPRVCLREIVSDSKAQPWTPQLRPISTLSAGGRALYPAVAATSTSIVAAWTEQTTAGSGIRVRRIAAAPTTSAP